MGFERLNGVFSCIAEMNVGQDKLVSHLPNFFHDSLVLFTGFIVQILEINKLITVFDPVPGIIVREESV